MPGYLLCQSDARTIPLPDRSVHCVVTSPPYFGLRDYGTAAWEGGDDPACDHLGEPKRTQAGFNERWSGKPPVSEDKQSETRQPMGRACRKCGARRIDRQIGLEGSIEAYVDVMVRVFREVRRCLRDDGTLWLNMGDGFASNQGKGFDTNKDGGIRKALAATSKVNTSLPQKNLLGMPWRVAFALQADGWTLRADIIWAKANPMPESVTDRPTKSHEYLFLLSKQSTYFYDAEAVREPHQEPWRSTGRLEQRGTKDVDGKINQGFGLDGIRPREYNPAGRNMRSVISLPTESWPGAHFATYPRKLVEPCIKAGSSERGCCPRCGAGWCRSIERSSYNRNHTDLKKLAKIDFFNDKGSGGNEGMIKSGKAWAEFKAANPDRHLGWVPSCQCPSHSPVPCTILDIFCGSGTTLVVANALGRRAIGLDLSREYLVNQAQRRLERPHAPHIRPARAEPAMPLFREED